MEKLESSFYELITMSVYVTMYERISVGKKVNIVQINLQFSISEMKLFFKTFVLYKKKFHSS